MLSSIPDLLGQYLVPLTESPVGSVNNLLRLEYQILADNGAVAVGMLEELFLHEYTSCLRRPTSSSSSSRSFIISRSLSLSLFTEALCFTRHRLADIRLRARDLCKSVWAEDMVQIDEVGVAGPERVCELELGAAIVEVDSRRFGKLGRSWLSWTRCVLRGDMELLFMSSIPKPDLGSISYNVPSLSELSLLSWHHTRRIEDNTPAVAQLQRQTDRGC